MIVVNDLHIGAIRSGGTTPQTALQLRKDLNVQFSALVDKADEDLMILGDLFDTANVPMVDLLETYYVLFDWCRTHPEYLLMLVAGNHDLSKDSSRLSSFQFLCDLLGRHYPNQVCAVFEPIRFYGDFHVIPHFPTQALFDAALADVPACKYLFLHCNYDNHFAQKSDHSLNLSAEQAEKLPVERIIIAHEHQKKEALNGKVLIIGNQFPSSVSDCLGNSAKYCLRVLDGRIEWLPTWVREGDYMGRSWRELPTERDDSDGDARFIRVDGTARASEAAEVVTAISRYRAISKALVITNAVQIEGIEDSGMDNLESVKAFDVMAALMELLDNDEQKTVKGLLNENS